MTALVGRLPPPVSVRAPSLGDVEGGLTACQWGLFCRLSEQPPGRPGARRMVHRACSRERRFCQSPGSMPRWKAHHSRT